MSSDEVMILTMVLISFSEDTSIHNSLTSSISNSTIHLLFQSWADDHSFLPSVMVILSGLNLPDLTGSIYFKELLLKFHLISHS